MASTTESVPETVRRAFAADDIRLQVQIQDLAISPDGEQVIYSRRAIVDNRYVTHLWRIPWTGGKPQQLTAVQSNDSKPAISPDGQVLAFISDRGGRKEPWLLPLLGGEARMAPHPDGDTKEVHWSPDGRRLLLLADSGIDRLSVGDPSDPTARVIDDFHWRLDSKGFISQLTSAWVASLEDERVHRVSDPEWEVLDVRWMADGAHIAVVADAEPDAGMRRRTEQAAVWKLPVKSNGEAEPLLSLNGGVSAVRPAPIGSTIAATGFDHPRKPSWADNHLFVSDGDGVRRLAPELDRPVENVTTSDLKVRGAAVSCEWFDDGSLVAQVDDAGCVLPYRIDVASGDAVPLVEGEIVCNAVATASGRVAIVASQLGEATDVYAVEGGGLRRLTEHGSEWLRPFRRDPVRHRLRHPQGHEQDVWVVSSDAVAKPGPTILHIHGGPHAAFGPTPWIEMLALADAGFTIIYPNPRGSSGYGEAFARAAHGNWGEVGSDDVLHAVDWAIESGIADPERVGVMGLSHGGYLTAWLLGHHPGRFKAAVSENPVSSFVSWYGGSDLQGYTDERFVGIGRLPEDIDAFLAASPFMQIHRNSAPLLLLQSEADLRCPPEQAETLFTILKERGVTTRLVRYPGESHFLAGIGRPDRRIDRLSRIVDWFTTYL
jgi:acylaminoacyl-peptidase